MGPSDHGLTPKQRGGAPGTRRRGRSQAVAFFDPTVEVREMTLFVRINCSDDPLVPTP